MLSQILPLVVMAEGLENLVGIISQLPLNVSKQRCVQHLVGFFLKRRDLDLKCLGSKAYSPDLLSSVTKARCAKVWQPSDVGVPTLELPAEERKELLLKGLSSRTTKLKAAKACWKLSCPENAVICLKDLFPTGRDCLVCA